MERGEYGDTYKRVVAYVGSRPTPGRARDLAEGLGLDVAVAAAWLGHALRRGHVERVRRGEYTAGRDD